MVYFAFAICILLLILSLRKSKNLYNPVIVFYIVWTIILFFNLIGAYRINKASTITYYYIIVGLISLFLGNIVGQNSKLYHVSFGRKNNNARYSVRYSIVYLMMLVTAIFLTFDVVVVIKALLSGNSLAVIRTWYTATFASGENPIEARRGFIEQVIRVIIIEPFLCALPVLCAINLYGEKKNNKFICGAICLLILNVIASGGGRLSILTYAFTFIFAFFIYKKRLNIDYSKIKKYKKWILSFSVVGIIAVSYLTTKRAATGLIEEIYYYFGMCIPLFDRWIPYIQKSVHTYGVLGGFGLIRIPFLIFEGLGFQVPQNYKLAQSYIIQANQFYNVGARSGNSFVSPFYYLLLDGGVVGIIIGMFLFGYISAVTYRKAKREFDEKKVYFLILLIQAALLSFIRWQFIGTAFAMAFVYSFIFFSKNNKKG